MRALTTETYQKSGTETEPVLLEWSLRRHEPSASSPLSNKVSLINWVGRIVQSRNPSPCIEIDPDTQSNFVFLAQSLNDSFRLVGREIWHDQIMAIREEPLTYWVQAAGLCLADDFAVCDDLSLEPAALSGEDLGLRSLGVPWSIEDGAHGLLDAHTCRAARMVVQIIHDEMRLGLPVTEIRLDRLDDYDSGHWSELVFRLRVLLDTQAANAAWDRLLYEIGKTADGLSDSNKAVGDALHDRMTVVLEWF